MPHDLFGDIVVRRGSVRSRSVVVASAVAHALVLLTGLIAPLLATDILPTPRQAFNFLESSHLVPVVTAPPRPVRAEGRASAPRASSISPPGTPIEAPTGITTETGFENGVGTVNGFSVPEVGVAEGVGTAIGRVEPPPPPPAPKTPVRLHSGIRRPQKILYVPPVYPALARAVRVQGIVIIEATIDEKGNVESARVLKGEPLLNQAALDAVRQWRFTPTLLSGVPVPVVMTVTVDFRLQ
jgi:periplasmic protein TonB